MALAKSDEVTAMVVLKPRGRTPAEPPSTRNLDQWAPAPGALEGAMEGFRAAGFKARGSGNSLEVTGTVAEFERFFGVKVREHRQGTVQSELVDGSRTSKLPLKKVPVKLRSLIHSVGFAEPPDYGPSNFA
jgi:hypothetical protein